MLDAFGLGRSRNSDVQIFNRPCTVTGLQYDTWRKPRGVSMAFMYLLGGGGGGGGGFTGIAGSPRGGGGGGGGSSTFRMIIPTIFLPDSLLVQVGAGGIGVSSGGGTAGSGLLSKVTVSPTELSHNTFAISGATGAVGGVTGTVAAAGTGGAAGTNVNSTSCMLGSSGILASVAGQAGVDGGAETGAVGASQAIPNTLLHVLGGAGGAGTTAADFAGGGITNVAGALVSERRPATPAAGSFDGSGGFMLPSLGFSYCGLGGSASNAGIGGNGGNGGPGAGGGGGGGGTTGGKGGDGGAGLVIIVCW